MGDLIIDRHPIGVYGTLMLGRHNHHVIARAVEHGPIAALLRGWEMRAAGTYPVIRRSADARAMVSLEVYDIAELKFTATMRRLDLLEDYRPGRKDNHYIRELVTVELWDGTPMPVWLYTGNATATEESHYARIGPDGKPHGDHYPLVVSGFWTPENGAAAWEAWDKEHA